MEYIKSEQANMDVYIERISQRRKILYTPANFNMKNPALILPKACRKLGIKYEYAGRKHSFGFKNVKSGNDIEGYIKYRGITIICDEDLKSKDVIYDFNNFSYRNSWQLSLIGNLHPHIATNANICFGNRGSDAQLYRTSGAYEFYALLLKESVGAYDPQNPYEKISSIIPKILALEKVAEINKVLDDAGDMITNATHPKEYARLLLTKLKKCRCCNGFLVPNPEHPDQESSCITDNCEANPNAEMQCPSCSVPMRRGVWNTQTARYAWECHNEECDSSVQAIERERVRQQRRLEIQRLIDSHFSQTTFTAKNGHQRTVAIFDGNYIPCPACNEPLTRDNNSIHCNAINVRHSSYLVYTLSDIWQNVYHELVNSTEPITALPDGALDLHAYYDNSFLGEIMGRLWLRNEPIKPNGEKYVLRDIAFYDTYAINRDSGDRIFVYAEVYRTALAEGLPPISYADQYFRANQITI